MAMKKYYHSYSSSSFSGEVELPDSGEPDQNAKLTLTMTYDMNFLDSRSAKFPTIVRVDTRYYAKDSDGWLFPILDWTMDECMKFHRLFRRGEKIWNQQFTLLTPQTFDKFDYQCLSGPGTGWLVRPNVECHYKLETTGRTAGLSIDVVRLDRTVTEVFKHTSNETKRVGNNSFRSNSMLYSEIDVKTPTLGHELGHALGLGHIKELKGDQQCTVGDKSALRCYGEDPIERANIMGAGTEMWPLNAKPWQNVIEAISNMPANAWSATCRGPIKPRKIPLGVAMINPVPPF
jgi:hypothetical protein